MTESMNDDPYGPALAALYAQKEDIETAIKALERLAGGPVPAGGIDRGMADDPVIKSDTFFRMSVQDAVKKCLSIRKRPLSTRELADLILQGGFITQSKNFRNIVYTGTHRLVKAGQVVRLEKDGTWGLAEWYPNRPKQQASKDGDPSGEPEEGGGSE